MKPAALRVEPLIMLSAAFFLFILLPLAIWISLKWTPKLRAITIGLGLITLVFLAFNLGRITGLSMAWYHWRSEYQQPLFELQISLKDDLDAKKTDALLIFAEKFQQEQINSYGGEKLFEKGPFRTFVDSL
jgi:hypothetical protein